MINVAALWRHPIKSHGREALADVLLETGRTMPWDRHWAVTHDRSKFSLDDPSWVMCRNFMTATRTPGLAGIWAELDSDQGRLRLRHTDLGEITFCPDSAKDVARFLDWVAPLCPAEKSRPIGIVAAPDRGMTDTDYPSVSLMTRASHDAVEAHIGHAVDPARWRGNIWVDGVDAWEEFDWIGKDIQVGAATLRVREPIERCMLTAANPITGLRDIDMLSALRNGWGHQNFGIYATVINGGKVQLNDKVEVL
jgi:uncharacterized protein YcbX